MSTIATNPGPAAVPLRRAVLSTRTGAFPPPTDPLRALGLAWSAADPRDAVRVAIGSAAAELAAHPEVESAWFALLRGKEILGETGPLRIASEAHASLRDATAAASRRFRSSARLSTLLARLDGGSAAARAAAAVAPAYGPAQVALGRALLREGSARLARSVLEAVEEPSRIQGGAVALAWARLETDEPGQALAAVGRELNAPGIFALEPAIHDPAIDREVALIRGLALLSLGAAEAGARALVGSVEAPGSPGRSSAPADVPALLARLAGDAARPPSIRALAQRMAAR